MKASCYHELLSMLDGDKNLASELIHIFIDEYHLLITRMENAVQEQDPDELHRAAHTLKGALGNMGASDALDLTLTLETMGLNGDLERAAAVVDRLRNQLESLELELLVHDRIPLQ